MNYAQAIFRLRDLKKYCMKQAKNINDFHEDVKALNYAIGFLRKNEE